MTPEELLEAVSARLVASRVKVDVLVGRVPATPARPYVVLVGQMPAVARRPLAGDSHQDRITVQVMAVNNSHEGALWLADRVRVVLSDLPVGVGRLRYDFASAPIESDQAGVYRWSVTADYFTFQARRFHD